MRKTGIRITSLILAAAFIAAAVSCSLIKNGSKLLEPEFTEFPTKAYNSDTVHPVRKPGKLSGDAAATELSAIEWDYIRHDIGSNYVNANWSFSDLEAAGIKIDKPSFGQVGPGDNKAECGYLGGLLERLYKIDFESLDKQDRDFYDQIVFDLEEERYIKQYEGFAYMQPALTAESASAFYVTLSYLDVRNKNEADLYIGLMKDADRYFSEICEFEKKRSEKGYTSVADFYTKSSVTYYMLTQKSRTEPLRESFIERINAIKELGEEEKNAYIAEFDKVMNEVMIPRFLECQKVFADLAKTTKNEKGLSGMAHGKELYEHLLRKQIGRDLDVAGLAKELDEALKLPPGGVNKPAPGSNNRERMDYVEKKAAEYFPELKINYEIDILPDSFRSVGIAGVYAAKHYDDPSAEIILLPEFLRNESVIYHEGIPGHMYQFNYHKTTLKHKYMLFKYKDTYVEGWATYIMDNPASMYGRTGSELTYNGNSCRHYMIQARADICLNYEGLSESETAKYLSGIMQENVKVLSDSIVMTPGIGISYGVGSYMTIKTLESIKSLDPDMSLLKMHTLYLDAGPGCFDRILASVRRQYEGG